MFLASNSLHNLRGQKWSCPCYHARHLQQIQWSKLLCGMYGFTAKLSVPPSTTMSLINKINIYCKISLQLPFPLKLSVQSTTRVPRMLWFLDPKSNHETRWLWIPRTVFSVKPQNGSKKFLKSTFWAFFHEIVHCCKDICFSQLRSIYFKSNFLIKV